MLNEVLIKPAGLILIKTLDSLCFLMSTKRSDGFIIITDALDAASLPVRSRSGR